MLIVAAGTLMLRTDAFTSDRRVEVDDEGPLTPILVTRSPPAYSRLRMTVAFEGHADRNSMDVCTPAGTSVRSMRSKPNRGKNPSAVVVSR
jgi:hypothetical protein